MNIVLKGNLGKVATINDIEVKVGKKNIATSDIIEIKYILPTFWKNGFLTFCTKTEGHQVVSLNTCLLTKNTIMVRNKELKTVQDIMEFFEKKDVVFTDIAKVQIDNIYKKHEQKIKSKNDFKRETKELEASNVVFCTKCHSQQVALNGKDISVGRAIVGGVAFGGVGAVVGGLSGKKGIVKCMKCGHSWKI